MSAAPRPSRLLVLTVDRDDDIGAKAAVKTPIVGKDSCVHAASTLAIADPEEADSNAIFAAVKLYDELLSKGYKCEVAVISGQYERGLEADQKLRDEASLLVAQTGAEGLILVTDGSEDEEVLPVLQAILPVVSVRRVVIKHSRTVEESYAVLGRYLRMLIYDPRYSKLALGIPGLIILLSAILVLLFPDSIRAILLLVAAMIGATLAFRGFDIDKRLEALTRLTPSAYLRLFSAIASSLIILVGFYTAFTVIAETSEYRLVLSDPVLLLKYGPFLLGVLLQQALNLVWTGLAIYFSGGFLFHWIRSSVKLWRDGVGLVMLLLLYLPVQQFSLILIGQGSTPTLVAQLLIGLAFTFLAVTMVYQYVRSRRQVSVES